MDFQTRYEFDPKKDLLGKGGFSKVYKATDILLERTVALKFFTAKTAEKYQILNEIKRVIRFEHPNLCKYYDVALLTYKNVLDETEQTEVGIMEFIDAGDFKNYVRKHPQHTDKLLTDVLKGLAFLHKHGMAHRDLKPQNILIKMVDEEPVGKITDFGISKVVGSGEGGDEANSSALLGTIEYMAPEQFNPKKYGINGRITTNLDLWSFGLLVYETVCNDSVFGSRSAGISAEQVMANILGDLPEEKTRVLPPKYREIVTRCLVKNASERVQNALELLPLFQDGTTSVSSAPAYLPIDSGKILITETQVLTPPMPLSGDVTQTLQASIDSAPIEQPVFEPETIAGEKAETATETEPINLEAADTQVLDRVTDTDETAEATQQLFITPAETDTQVLTPVPPPSHEDEPATEVLDKGFVKPETNVKSNYDKMWTEAVQHSARKKQIARARTRALVLGLAAVLLIVVFIGYPLLKSQEKPALVMDKNSENNSVAKAPVPAFVPPVTTPVSGGTFTMGDESGVDATAPARTVAVNDFWISPSEVTVYEFGRFVGATGYRTTAEEKGYSSVFVKGQWDSGKGINWRYDFKGSRLDTADKTMPVVHVSWKDANRYCRWLSEKTGETFRLPTEAEWEFAARGGDSSKHFLFSGSNNVSDVAWYENNAGGALHPVKQKAPNELQLYDMSGNASEWCQDRYSAESGSDQKDSPEQNTAGNRVIRGGAWSAGKEYCKNFGRYHFAEDVSGASIGFRICKEKR